MKDTVIEPRKRFAVLSSVKRRFWTTSTARVQVLLFFFVWLVYGAAINSENLVNFNLQHIGVEAIAERGHFYLEGSWSPYLFPLGDVFFHDGHKFAAKQPGQFMAGAVAYSLLRLLGFKYTDNYLVTAALVTFFTTSFVLALSTIAVFRIGRRLAKHRTSIFWPLLTALAYGLSTTVLAYSGIAHHDALATGYLVIAFDLVQGVAKPSREGHAILSSIVAGLLLGFAITTSMLVLFMVLVCVIFFLHLRRWKLFTLFLAGVFLGLVPLFIYCAVSFGNPLLLPNIVGAHMFADTFFHFDLANFGAKLKSYSSALALYSPIFLLGLFGATYLPADFKRGSVFMTILLMLILLVAYVMNIKTGGDCQFGPRYLLPAMPFACLGITGYSYLSRKREEQLAGIILVVVGVVSFFINLVGALEGTMCCPDGRRAFRSQLTRLVHGEVHSFPLGVWLIVPLFLTTVLFVSTLVRRRTNYFTR